jgi:O-antigen ligase
MARLVGGAERTMNLGRLNAWFTCVCLVMFAYSGLMKWLPVFPLDPTVMFGALLALPVGFSAIDGLPRLRGIVEVVVLVTLLFFAWYAFTAIYSVSGQFWMRKELTLVLDLLAFAVPLACFQTSQHFRAFNLTVAALALVATAIVLGMYATGTIALLLGPKVAPMTSKIPDYLAIGSLVGCGVLIAMARPRLVNLVIAGAGLAAMLVLTARGPILFVVLLIPLGFFLYRGRDGSDKSGAWRYLLILAVGAVAFTQWKGAEASFTRFTKVFASGRDFDQTLRVDEFAVAGDVISDHPVWGVGLGGYGRAGYGADEDIYPHNLFLEAFAEAGVFGVTLFTLSILLTMIAALKLRRLSAMMYFSLFMFLVLNYSKSGGFVGARDLYMFMGVFLAYVNQPAIDDERYRAFGLAKSGARA